MAETTFSMLGTGHLIVGSTKYTLHTEKTGYETVLQQEGGNNIKLNLGTRHLDLFISIFPALYDSHVTRRLLQ